MKILITPFIVWNFNRGRSQELAISLDRVGHDCIYIEPIKYIDKDKNSISARSKDLSNTPIPKRRELVKRSSKLGKSFFLFVYETVKNVFLVSAYKLYISISNDHLMNILPCIACKMEKIFVGIYNE